LEGSRSPNNRPGIPVMIQKNINRTVHLDSFSYLSSMSSRSINEIIGSSVGWCPLSGTETA